MTKSLDRLKRLAKREGIKFPVDFVPGCNSPQHRYILVLSTVGNTSEVTPLGRNAQEARATLRSMKGDSHA